MSRPDFSHARRLRGLFLSGGPFELFCRFPAGMGPPSLRLDALAPRPDQLRGADPRLPRTLLPSAGPAPDLTRYRDDSGTLSGEYLGTFLDADDRPVGQFRVAVTPLPGGPL